MATSYNNKKIKKHIFKLYILHNKKISSISKNFL